MSDCKDVKDNRTQPSGTHGGYPKPSAQNSSMSEHGITWHRQLLHGAGGRERADLGARSTGLISSGGRGTHSDAMPYTMSSCSGTPVVPGGAAGSESAGADVRGPSSWATKGTRSTPHTSSPQLRTACLAQRQVGAESGDGAVLQYLGWIAPVISLLVWGVYRNLPLRGSRKFLWRVYKASQFDEQHLAAAAEAFKAIQKSSPGMSLAKVPRRGQRARSSPSRLTPLARPPDGSRRVNS